VDPDPLPNPIWDEDEQRLFRGAEVARWPSPRSPPAARPTTSAPGRSGAASGSTPSLSRTGRVSCSPTIATARSCRLPTDQAKAR
jgi:hypothetical protein